MFGSPASFSFGALLVAMVGWLVAALVTYVFFVFTGFLTIGVIGLLICFISLRIELESGSIVGTVSSPDSFRRQVERQQAMSRAERAAARHEQSLTARSARFFLNLGIALALIGFGGFIYYQL
ncbi:MAG: hypothetical protein J0H44_11790 [Alphaproteobacteria bacterium]|nr:hypothetical protein [Alphaproteobacteria bacterium]